MTLGPGASDKNPTDRAFNKSVVIAAPADLVWEALTDPDRMKEWMFHSAIEITTDWTVGGPFVIKGELHGIPFANRGRVLSFDRPVLIEYTHLSSASRLADEPEHYARIRFVLSAVSADETRLTIDISGAPSDVIHKHLAFYWNSTLEILKRHIEGQSSDME